MLEAHARGFHHMMFDDNLPPPRSDHFSVKGACTASRGEFKGLTAWDDFRGIKTVWYPWKHGQFNVTDRQLRWVGDSFSSVVDIYAEMPPLWSAAGVHRPEYPRPLMDVEAGRAFVEQHIKNTCARLVQRPSHTTVFHTCTPSRGRRRSLARFTIRGM